MNQKKIMVREFLMKTNINTKANFWSIFFQKDLRTEEARFFSPSGESQNHSSEDAHPSQAMVEVERYGSTTAEALAFTSFAVNMNHSVYIISRLALPGSVSASDITLEVFPSLRKIMISFVMGVLTTNSFV